MVERERSAKLIVFDVSRVPWRIFFVNNFFPASLWVPTGVVPIDAKVKSFRELILILRHDCIERGSRELEMLRHRTGPLQYHLTLKAE